MQNLMLITKMTLVFGFGTSGRRRRDLKIAKSDFYGPMTERPRLPKFLEIASRSWTAVLSTQQEDKTLLTCVEKVADHSYLLVMLGE